MSATCSKCETHLFATKDGWECPVCDWLPAVNLLHALGFEDAAALEAAVKGLVIATADLADEQALFAAQLPPIYANRLEAAKSALAPFASLLANPEGGAVANGGESATGVATEAT